MSSSLGGSDQQKTSYYRLRVAQRNVDEVIYMVNSLYDCLATVVAVVAVVAAMRVVANIAAVAAEISFF